MYSFDIQVRPKGRRVITAAVPKMVAPLKRAFSDLTPEAFATLEMLLRKTILSFDLGAQVLKESA